MNNKINNSFIFLIYLFLYLPIAVLIVYSFNNAQFSLLWHGATLHWYRVLFQDNAIWLATWHSLILGVLASFLATLLGSLAAISLYQYRFFAKNSFYALIFILIIVPDIVMGIALLIFFNTINIPLGFTSLLLAHISFCIPFVVITISSRLSTVDKNIFIAAKDLGATDWEILFKITIPFLKTAFLSAFLLSFTLSFDDVIISYFVSGPTFTILPLQIYSLIREGIKPELNALCTLIFLMTLILIFSTQKLMKKQ